MPKCPGHPQRQTGTPELRHDRCLDAAISMVIDRYLDPGIAEPIEPQGGEESVSGAPVELTHTLECRHADRFVLPAWRVSVCSKVRDNTV